MKKLIILSTALLSLGLGSCKKYLDINKNPNQAESVTPGLLFNYASASYAGNRASGDSYIPLALAAQTIASGGNYGWGAADVYDMSIYSLGNTWKMYYSTSGNNLKLAIKNAESATPALNGAAAQSKILLAQLMYEATMLWGDIPFTEAWQANEFPYPKFDNQETVLNSIVALIDEALEQLPASNGTAITGEDLFYKGDVTKWRAAAKSIRFRTLFSLVDRVPSAATQIGQMINEGGMISAANQNFRFPFGTTPGTENPKYRILATYAGGNNIFFFANKLVLDPMNAQNDPRIPKYFDAPDGQNYIGVVSEQEADENTATISMDLYRRDAPELIFTLQEQLFLEAEAYARGLGVAQDLGMAEAKYKAALTAASLYYGVSSAEATAFADSKNLPTSQTDALKEIYLQSWIDLMDRPLEAFTVWRRSGPEGQEVPALTPPVGTPNNGLFRRYVYPLNEEINLNPNAPQSEVHYFDKLWFDL